MPEIVNIETGTMYDEPPTMTEEEMSEYAESDIGDLVDAEFREPEEVDDEDDDAQFFRTLRDRRPQNLIDEEFREPITSGITVSSTSDTGITAGPLYTSDGIYVYHTSATGLRATGGHTVNPWYPNSWGTDAQSTAPISPDTQLIERILQSFRIFGNTYLPSNLSDDLIENLRDFYRQLAGGLYQNAEITTSYDESTHTINVRVIPNVMSGQIVVNLKIEGPPIPVEEPKVIPPGYWNSIHIEA